MTRGIVTFAGILVASAACTGSDGGPARGAVAVQLALTASDQRVRLAPGALAGADAQGKALVIEDAVAHVRHIELDLPDGRSCADFSDFEFRAPVRCGEDSSDDRPDADGDDDSEDKIVIDGPFVVDLVTGRATPAIDALTLPAGVYKRVDVRFDRAERATEALGDDTLVAGGEYDPSGRALPFELRLRFSEDARFESANGVEVGGAAASEILLWLDVSTWFGALPMTRCIDSGELEISQRVLRIDESSDCGDIENELKHAIKNSADLD